MNRNSIGILIALIALLGGWYFFLKPTPMNTPAPATAETNTPQQTAPTTAPSTGTTVSYTSDGFSPKTLTVPKGTTITFSNQTSERMWVASAKHPTHETYDNSVMSEHCAAGYTGSVPFDQCVASASYSFTFTKPGIWGYHNHANAAHFGSVTVTP